MKKLSIAIKFICTIILVLSVLLMTQNILVITRAANPEEIFTEYFNYASLSVLFHYNNFVYPILTLGLTSITCILSGVSIFKDNKKLLNCTGFIITASMISQFIVFESLRNVHGSKKNILLALLIMLIITVILNIISSVYAKKTKDSN